MKKLFEITILLLLFVALVFLSRDKLAVFYYNKANNYYENGSYQEAIGNFKKSLFLKPAYVLGHYGLGNAYRGAALENMALEEYKKTTQLDKKFTWGYKALADIYLKKQMYDQSLAFLKQASVIDAQDKDIQESINYVSFEYVAYCLDEAANKFNSGNKQEAYVLLDTALKIDPKSLFSYYTLGYFYYADGNYDLAINNLNQALQIDPSFWMASKLLGTIYLEKGLFRNAIEQYESAIKYNSSDANLYNDLGIALMNLERYDEAIVPLKKALELDPKNNNIHYSLASVYRDSSRPDEALAEYERLVSIQPNYPNVHNDMADIYKQKKDEPSARQEYSNELEYCRTKLSVDPRDIVALNNMAYAYNGLGQSEKAKGLIDKVLELEPGYRQAYLTLGKIYEKTGNTEEAVNVLKKAKQLSRESGFITQEISRVRQEFMPFSKNVIPANLTTVYLKNGRQIKGVIKNETEDSIDLEIITDTSRGTINLSRSNIERIEK